MSRCLPYPPPGYTPSRANYDALIESIKLQKEKGKTREHKKEKISEKEKRKENRKHEKDYQNKMVHKFDISKSRTLGKLPDEKEEAMLKGKEIETESLERSNLTQEHGLPVRLDDLPTSSAESTDTSNKRKRHSSPLNYNRTHGNIICIKLASKKQKTGTNASVNELRVITKSKITNLSAENHDPKNIWKHDREDSNVAVKTNGVQICSTPSPAESLRMSSEKLIPALPNAVMTSLGRKERKYDELIRNWSPPQLLRQNLDTDDLDWLVRTPEVASEKSRKTQNNGVSCLSSSSLIQPRAQLLNDINMYALPFTVPF